MSDGIFYYPKYLLYGKFIYISKAATESDTKRDEIFRRIRTRACLYERQWRITFEATPSRSLEDLTAENINIYYLDIKCFEAEIFQAEEAKGFQTTFH